jgi:hypothetical protein
VGTAHLAEMAGTSPAMTVRFDLPLRIEMAPYMKLMRRFLFIAMFLTAALPAMAQDVPGYQVPPLPPPILPKIEVPPVPKLDELPTQRSSKRPQQTFQDRAIDCQHQAGAAGLSPTDVASYTRACANQ